MTKFVSIVFAIIVLSIVSSGFYIVNETEQVVVTRFGKTIGQSIRNPGIYFKLPVIDKAIFFEKRMMEWDGDANQIPTKDKKYILIDATARWRIVDPLVFLQTVGDETGAQTRLDDIIDSSVRNEVTSHNLIELVRNSNRAIDVIKQEELEADTGEEVVIERVEVGREKITRNIVKKAIPIISKYGIELVDVRIKGLNYESSVQEKVFNRMISERNKIAEKLRSGGSAEKAKIQGKLSLDLKTIESQAYKKAQFIKGDAEAEAAKIYAGAFSIDPDLYQFLTSLEAYEKAVEDNGTFVLSSDAAFFRVLKTGE